MAFVAHYGIGKPCSIFIAMSVSSTDQGIEFGHRVKNRAYSAARSIRLGLVFVLRASDAVQGGGAVGA